MSEAQPSVYRALNDEERAALEDGLLLASKLAAVENLAGIGAALSMAHVQALYDKALAKKIQNDAVLTAIGLAFGQQIIAQSGFEWVHLSDEYGAETVVGPAGKSINCAPISMVKKRLEREEDVDLQWLATEIIGRIDALLAENNTEDWR